MSREDTRYNTVGEGLAPPAHTVGGDVPGASQRYNTVGEGLAPPATIALSVGYAATSPIGGGFEALP